MDIKIITATHKKYPMPKEPMYLPVLAGSALYGKEPEGFVRDDSGEHISDRNRLYSELTALYWAWKNLPSDYLGLCHYRRYLTASRRGKKHSVLKENELQEILRSKDIVLAKERHYVIETNYSHYAHAHHREDLDMARAVIAEKYPEYLEAFDRRMAMRRGHRFNIFIMRRDLADRYCDWLFDILSEAEGRLDVTGYEGQDARVLGLLAERLLDVWLDKQELSYAELPYMMTEKEHMVRKAFHLIGRKLRGKKS